MSSPTASSRCSTSGSTSTRTTSTAASSGGRSARRPSSGPLTGALVFLGRHELAPQTDPIAAPFFFQIERNDIYDASVGLRWRFAETGFVSANAIVPLNDDGLRADVIPTVEVEYAFSAPW